MLWFANENFLLASIMKLRAQGHDIASILYDSPGIADDAVRARAVRESCVILTFDRNYGELIFQRKSTSASVPRHQGLSTSVWYQALRKSLPSD